MTLADGAHHANSRSPRSRPRHRIHGGRKWSPNHARRAAAHRRIHLRGGVSADEALAAGAQDVVFNQPLIRYVENFLSFPAGTTVPVGYYDEEKAAWVPSESGVVLKIVTISGSLAELDVTGDDLADPPAALAAWGITDAERGRLAKLYPAGKSLWRYPVQHFSSWDANWGTRL